MTPIDLSAFLRSRRSIRRFKPDPVPDSVLTDILYTATFAPSAHHRQPWRFAIATEEQDKARLAEGMAKTFKKDLHEDNLATDEIDKRVKRSRDRILTAPAVIVLCVDMSDMDSYPDTRRKKAEYLMATQSVANAGMQLLLAAHAAGLAGVWVCSPLFAQEAVQFALDLPGTWEPQAMFFIGFPADKVDARERIPLEKIIKWTRTSGDV